MDCTNEFRPLFKKLLLSGTFVLSIFNSLQAEQYYYSYQDDNQYTDQQPYYDQQSEYSSPSEAYNAKIRNGNWDYHNKWHYHSDAYLSGENQAQYYQRMHQQGNGGIGYDSVKDNQPMKIR